MNRAIVLTAFEHRGCNGAARRVSADGLGDTRLGGRSLGGSTERSFVEVVPPAPLSDPRCAATRRRTKDLSVIAAARIAIATSTATGISACPAVSCLEVSATPAPGSTALAVPHYARAGVAQPLTAGDGRAQVKLRFEVRFVRESPRKVTNQGHDRMQLASMAKLKARQGWARRRRFDGARRSRCSELPRPGNERRNYHSTSADGRSLDGGVRRQRPLAWREVTSTA